MQPGSFAAARSSSHDATETSTMLLWDHQDCIPLSRVLRSDDIILLLTPVVVPYNNSPENNRDPFETLGRAIAARHPRVQHVPYTKAKGLTDWHGEFMTESKAIIFVISGPPIPGDPSQVEFAKLAQRLGTEQPQVIVACCSLQALRLQEGSFPTIVQVAGYSPKELEIAAAILFGEARAAPSSGVNVQNLIMAPRTWSVEEWQANRDLTSVHELWAESLPKKFHLSHFVLGSLLKREGWAAHYIVREPESGELVGFCATYTTYPDSDPVRLIGSLAVIIVRQSYRRRGIGRSLHDFALKQLSRTRGVDRLQLGSTFPRLMYGLPSELASREWFARRGWQMDQRRFEVSDWLLKFEDMPTNSFSSAGLTFRPCDMLEFQQVLEIVDRDSARKNNMGWYEEYAKLANTIHVRDIVLGFEGSTIVATALTYIPNSGNPVADDLPWAKTIGQDVGGVTCVCIADDNPEMVNSRDSVMIRLLDTCIKMLAEQGMRHLFIDGVKGGDEGFQSIGFQKWATYNDLWRKV